MIYIVYTNYIDNIMYMIDNQYIMYFVDFQIVTAKCLIRRTLSFETLGEPKKQGDSRGLDTLKKTVFFIFGLFVDNQGFKLKKVAQMQFDNTCYLGRVVIFSRLGFLGPQKHGF